MMREENYDPQHKTEVKFTITVRVRMPSPQHYTLLQLTRTVCDVCVCVCDDAKASPMSQRFERWSRFRTVALNERFQSIYCPVGVIWSADISITVIDHLRHFKKYITTDKWQKTSKMLRSVSTGDCCQTPAQARAQHHQPLCGDQAVRPGGREQVHDYCLPWVESGCGAALLSFSFVVNMVTRAIDNWKTQNWERFNYRNCVFFLETCQGFAGVHC